MILVSLMASVGKGARRLLKSAARQRPDRERERSVRRTALAVFKVLTRGGMSSACAAARLGLDVRTLASWQTKWEGDRLGVRPRGRKPISPDRKTHREILEVFTLMGPEVPVSVLENLFPTVSRRELTRHRDLWEDRTRRRRAVTIHAVRFARAGTVWATDFGTAPLPLDGVFPHFLPVRDLATAKTLDALPVKEQTGAVVRDALAALFAEYGPPLVLKFDNGSAFLDGETKDFLELHGVLPLYSPPGVPEYNGAAETGVGSLKTFAHYESARRDRPGEWTCDDLEAARLRGNQIGRPFGRKGLTPDEAWARRTPITTAERTLLQQECDRQREKERAHRGLLPHIELSHRDQASLDRIAISRALLDLGYLTIRRRRISPPISAKKHAKITA